MQRSRRPSNELNVVQTIRANCRALLATAAEVGQTEESIARAAGLSLRNLQYLKTGQYAPTLRTVEGFAKAFGIDAWQLLLEDLPADLVLDRRLSKTVRAYLRAGAPQRAAVDHVTDLIDPPTAAAG